LPIHSKPFQFSARSSSLVLCLDRAFILSVHLSGHA